MGLADAEFADGDDVLLARDVFAPRKLQDEILVKRGDRREVEAVEVFHRREPRVLDAAVDQLSFALYEFRLGQTQQITGRVETSAGVLLGTPLILGEERRQFQRFEVTSQEPVSLARRR